MLTRSSFANIQSNCSICSHGYPQNMGTVGRLVERATAPANGHGGLARLQRPIRRTKNMASPPHRG